MLVGRGEGGLGGGIRAALPIQLFSSTAAGFMIILYKYILLFVKVV